MSSLQICGVQWWRWPAAVAVDRTPIGGRKSGWTESGHFFAPPDSPWDGPDQVSDLEF